MGLTTTNNTGDGVAVNKISASIALPDAWPDNINFTGFVQPVGGSPIAFTGSPIVGPAVPGSGITYANLQVNLTTGAVTLQTSASGDPAALDNNHVVIYRFQVPAGATDPSFLTVASTPDDW